MAKSRGMIIPPGFSASKLFQRISSSVRLVPSMIRAVQLLNKAGEVTTISPSNVFSFGA